MVFFTSSLGQMLNTDELFIFDADAQVSSLEEHRVANPDRPTEVMGGSSSEDDFFDDESIDMMAFSE